MELTTNEIIEAVLIADLDVLSPFILSVAKSRHQYTVCYLFREDLIPFIKLTGSLDKKFDFSMEVDAVEVIPIKNPYSTTGLGYNQKVTSYKLTVHYLPKPSHKPFRLDGGIKEIWFASLESFRKATPLPLIEHDQLKNLKLKLEEAIEEERYEDAAIIKREIEALGITSANGFNTDALISD